MKCSGVHGQCGAGEDPARELSTEIPDTEGRVERGVECGSARDEVIVRASNFSLQSGVREGAFVYPKDIGG